MWAAVAWTAFVWIGRIRNALADTTISTGALRAALTMSAVSLLLAAAVAGWAVALRSGPEAPEAPEAPAGLRTLVAVTLVWNVLLWLVRIADIAFSGRYDAPFIAVHTTLGIASVGLWALAFTTLPEGRSKEIPGLG